MKRIAIAVLAILPAISLYSLWLLVSSHDTEDIYFAPHLSTNKEEHIGFLDSIPVGSVIQINYMNRFSMNYIIGTYCKLDTVTANFVVSDGGHLYTVVCEVSKKRERKNFDDYLHEYGE